MPTNNSTNPTPFNNLHTALLNLGAKPYDTPDQYELPGGGCVLTERDGAELLLSTSTEVYLSQPSNPEDASAPALTKDQLDEQALAIAEEELFPPLEAAGWQQGHPPHYSSSMEDDFAGTYTCEWTFRAANEADALRAVTAVAQLNLVYITEA